MTETHMNYKKLQSPLHALLTDIGRETTKLERTSLNYGKNDHFMEDFTSPVRLKENSYKVQRNHNSYAPSILFELCFIAEEAVRQK